MALELLLVVGTLSIPEDPCPRTGPRGPRTGPRTGGLENGKWSQSPFLYVSGICTGEFRGLRSFGVQNAFVLPYHTFPLKILTLPVSSTFPLLKSHLPVAFNLALPCIRGATNPLPSPLCNLIHSGVSLPCDHHVSSVTSFPSCITFHWPLAGDSQLLRLQSTFAGARAFGRFWPFVRGIRYKQLPMSIVIFYFHKNNKYI